MKSLSYYLMSLALLSLLAACGKDNESGKKSNQYPHSNGYNYPNYQNPYQNPYANNPQYPNTVNSPYMYGNVSVNEVINRNPCMTGGGRLQAQFPLMGFPTVIPANDIYVGVTSVGDVALIVGQGGGVPPLFVTYLCQRGYTQQGQGMLTDLAFGSYSRCNFKPITRATMTIPGSPTPLYFRWLDGGNSMRQPFGPPVCF
jgi:hypothetical protein